jgi:hypothetical protein
MRFLKRTFPVIFVFLILCSFTMHPDAESFFESGHKNLTEKNYMKAIGDYTMAISLRPEYGIAYLERARAKLQFAEKMGYVNNEYCFDLVQALLFGEKDAIPLLEGGCDSECFGLEKAFIEPEIVFCADFSSKLISDLPIPSEGLTNITKLNLFNNKLTTISNRFSKLKSLLLLDISSNKLEDLGPVIGDLFNLNELNLNKNELQNLPEQIAKLKNLQKLFIRANKLTTLNKAIGQCEKLEHLDLSLNALTILPTEIGQLKNLKTLNLVGNTIDKKHQKYIVSLLPNTQIYF